jgi:hypothetical protein
MTLVMNTDRVEEGELGMHPVLHLQHRRLHPNLDEAVNDRIRGAESNGLC